MENEPENITLINLIAEKSLRHTNLIAGIITLVIFFGGLFLIHLISN